MTLSDRIKSIDVFRAITMFFMIFVNDLWTLKEIPGWLEHSAAEEDAMGLADTIFPAFLFIVGLSIPFAISVRIVKGDIKRTVAMHVLERFFALLLMGLFTVNLENIYSEGMIISKYLWQILMIVAFFLIWNAYPKDAGKTKLYTGLKITGYLLLIVLAGLYKGGSGEHTTWMGIHWWGILGLIAWSYLICSMVYLFIGDNTIAIAITWLFFVVFNIAAFAGILDFLSPVKDYVWIVGDGSMPAFTMAGVFASVIYRNFTSSSRQHYYTWLLIGLGILCLLIGFGVRPFWGISKIRATPAWVGICSGISFITYSLLFWLADLKNKQSWFDILKPAGIATLTCYLVPYLWHPVVELLQLNLPDAYIIGWVGIIKSLLFSLVIILITGRLNKVGVKLKV